jgi:hypothetical protein
MRNPKIIESDNTTVASRRAESLLPEVPFLASTVQGVRVFQ